MSNQSNPFSAGESALGYLYQCRLALWFALVRLREREETDVAIESLDDVTFSTDGKPIELLQTKHHLNAKANLADTSPDLWKTLRVWASQVSLVRDGVRLFLISTSVASKASAAETLRNGPGRDVAAAQKRLREALATSMSKENASAYTAFNELSPENQFELLNAVIVIDGSPNAVARARCRRLIGLARQRRPGSCPSDIQRINGLRSAIVACVAGDRHRPCGSGRRALSGSSC